MSQGRAVQAAIEQSRYSTLLEMAFQIARVLDVPQKEAGPALLLGPLVFTTRPNLDCGLWQRDNSASQRESTTSREGPPLI